MFSIAVDLDGLVVVLSNKVMTFWYSILLYIYVNLCSSIACFLFSADMYLSLSVLLVFIKLRILWCFFSCISNRNRFYFLWVTCNLNKLLQLIFYLLNGVINKFIIKWYYFSSFYLRYILTSFIFNNFFVLSNNFIVSGIKISR